MPSDPSFYVHVLDQVETSHIRPGLHLNLEVTFTPNEPRDYKDQILIIPGPDEPPTTITLDCYRDPPKLVLPDIIELGATLVHNLKTGTFTITNQGGLADFNILSNLGIENDQGQYQDGAFVLAPSTFTLEHNEETTITISFKPTEQGFTSVSFEVRPQFFKDTFFFIAKGEGAVPRLKFTVTDQMTLFLPFLPSQSSTTREIQIVNDSNVFVSLLCTDCQTKGKSSEQVVHNVSRNRHKKDQEVFSFFCSASFRHNRSQ